MIRTFQCRNLFGDILDIIAQPMRRSEIRTQGLSFPRGGHMVAGTSTDPDLPMNINECPRISAVAHHGPRDTDADTS